jgi:hypothetical protein
MDSMDVLKVCIDSTHGIYCMDKASIFNLMNSMAIPCSLGFDRRRPPRPVRRQSKRRQSSRRLVCFGVGGYLWPSHARGFWIQAFSNKGCVHHAMQDPTTQPQCTPHPPKSPNANSEITYGGWEFRGVVGQYRTHAEESPAHAKLNMEVGHFNLETWVFGCLCVCVCVCVCVFVCVCVCVCVCVFVSLLCVPRG